MEDLPGTESEHQHDTPVETINAFGEGDHHFPGLPARVPLAAPWQKRVYGLPCWMPALLASSSKPGEATNFPGPSPYQPKGEEPEFTSGPDIINKIW